MAILPRHRRPNIDQEGPCLLGLCIDGTSPWSDTSLPALPPLLQPCCTFQSFQWLLGALIILEHQDSYYPDEVEENQRN
jgi:hypothetical protein